MTSKKLLVHFEFVLGICWNVKQQFMQCMKFFKLQGVILVDISNLFNSDGGFSQIQSQLLNELYLL